RSTDSSSQRRSLSCRHPPTWHRSDTGRSHRRRKYPRRQPESGLPWRQRLRSPEGLGAVSCLFSCHSQTRTGAGSYPTTEKPLALLSLVIDALIAPPTCPARSNLKRGETTTSHPVGGIATRRMSSFYDRSMTVR